jgi:hypothetical protein
LCVWAQAIGNKQHLPHQWHWVLSVSQKHFTYRVLKKLTYMMNLFVHLRCQMNFIFIFFFYFFAFLRKNYVYDHIYVSNITHATQDDKKRHLTNYCIGLLMWTSKRARERVRVKQIGIARLLPIKLNDSIVWKLEWKNILLIPIFIFLLSFK